MPPLKANLFPRGTVLAGLRGSGKSNAARYLAAMDPDAVLVYDPQGEFPEYDRIQPKKSTYPETAEEFSRICEKMKLEDTTKHNYRLLIVDEAHLIAPNSHSLHPYVAQMNARHRHWPMGVVWIVQRPRQLHYNVFNLADYLFLWRLPGATDTRVLEDTSKGLSEAADALGEYQYVFVDRDRRYYPMPPLPNMDAGKGG